MAPLIDMMLHHKCETLRSKAGKVFSSVVQNNQRVQRYALEHSALQLIDQFDLESSLVLKEQVLSSLSCTAILRLTIS